MQACISKSHLFGLMPLHSFEYVVERRHYSELLGGADAGLPCCTGCAVEVLSF